MEATVIYLSKSAGILAIFFFSYQLFLKKETFFKINRHYLLVGILGSLLLPLVIFTNYIYVEPIVETFNPNWLLNDFPLTYNNVEEAEPFNWFQFATYTYIIGVLIFGMHFAIQITSLFKLFKTNTIKKKDGFNLVEISTNMSPFSFFNYIVYNPNKYNSKDLEIIMNHEKAHSNQLHSIDIILSQLFVILQWFNPVAWFYKKSIQQNLEFMADQFAMSKVNSAKHYQHTLLKASLKPQYASITNNFYNSLIKKRIIMLNQTKSNIKNTWKYFVVLPALAFFLMSFNVENIEVVKETEAKKLPTASDSSFMTSEIIVNNDNSTDDNKTKVEAFSNSETASISNIFQKTIKEKIDKNTTDEELITISEDLKKKGIIFTYKNVKRNSNNEIIGINITYKDYKGNTGNYALSSESPINTFYFYKEENGSIGIKSDNVNSIQRLRIIEERELAKANKDEMKKEREHMMQERMKMMEEHKALGEEKKREIEVRIEEAREKHKQMREEHEKEREEYQIQRKYIIKERMKPHDSLKNKHGNIFIEKHNGHDKDKLFFSGKDRMLFIVDGEESDGGSVRLLSPGQIEKMEVLKGEHAFNMYGEKGKDGVVLIFTDPENGKKNAYKYKFPKTKIEIHKDQENDKEAHISYHFEEHDDERNVKIFKHLPKDSKTMLLKKSASDGFLKSMKSFFKDEGIDFKYSKLKRNKDGKITSIKITLSDKEGNKSSATWKDNNQGIPNILVGKIGQSLIASSNY